MSWKCLIHKASISRNFFCLVKMLPNKPECVFKPLSTGLLQNGNICFDRLMLFRWCFRQRLGLLGAITENLNCKNLLCNFLHLKITACASVDRTEHQTFCLKKWWLSQLSQIILCLWNTCRISSFQRSSFKDIEQTSMAKRYIFRHVLGSVLWLTAPNAINHTFL